MSLNWTPHHPTGLGIESPALGKYSSTVHCTVSRNVCPHASKIIDELGSGRIRSMDVFFHPFFGGSTKTIKVCGISLSIITTILI